MLGTHRSTCTENDEGLLIQRDTHLLSLLGEDIMKSVASCESGVENQHSNRLLRIWFGTCIVL